MSRHSVHTIYKTSTGAVVPGVTTVLSMLNKENLLEWAWKLGLAGDDYKKVRDTSAHIGTITHYLAECHFKNKEPDLQDYAPSDVEIARKSFESLKKFLTAHSFKPLLIEHPITSDLYKFGGTIDWYGELDGENTLIDLKTSNAVYPEMRVQVAAYEYLLGEQNYPAKNKIILRVDKQSGEYAIHQFGDLSKEWAFFINLVRAYHIKKDFWK